MYSALRRSWSRPSLARNVAASWASTGVTIVSALIVTPIVVKALDKELYGIWSFLNGLLTYADLLHFGLGTALVKYAAPHIAGRDVPSLNRICSVVFSNYLVVGLLSMAAAVLIAPLLPFMFAQGLDAVSAARATCLLLGVRVLFLFVGTVFAAVLVAAERTDVARLVTIAFTLLRLAVVPFVVRARSPLVALAIVVVVSAIAEAAVTVWLAHRFVAGLRPRLVLPESAELRILYGFGLQAFVLTMAVKLVSYTDQTVIGVMLGAASVALYALPLQLVEYGRVLVNGMAAVLLPRLTVLSARNDFQALGRAYVDIARVSLAVAAVINVQFIVLGPAFLTRWVGPEFGQSARPVLVCLGIASIFQALSTQAALPFYVATGHLRVPALVLLAEGVANLALSIALAPRMGLTGVAVGTVIPAFCVSFVALPLHLCRTLRVRPAQLLREAVGPGVAIAILTTVVAGSLNAVSDANAYDVLAAKAVLSTLIACVAALAISRRERDALVALAGSLRRPVPSVAFGLEK